MNNIISIVMCVIIASVCTLCVDLFNEIKELRDAKKLTQRERETLWFIYNRLVNLYGEKETLDFMQKLKRIIDND